jgi:hypothetical protein
MVRPKHAVLLALVPWLAAAAPGGGSRAPLPDAIRGAAVALADVADDPPSSLDPGAPRGRIHFTHAHDRVVACREQRKDGALTCRDTREPAGAALTLQLHPIADSRTISGEDKRQAVSVSLVGDDGRAEKRVVLGVGDWEIEWAGRPRREAFRVLDGDDYKIKLRTVSGECRKRDDECRLVPEARVQEVSVPKAHRCGS